VQTTHRLALTVLATALMVAGCANDPEPKFADPTTSEPTFSDTGSPTATTDPTNETTGGLIEPVEPEYPAAAKGEGKSAAVAFVKYYVDMLDYAQATGELETLRSLGTQTCQGCNGAADLIEDTYRAGGHYEGLKRSIKVTFTDTGNVGGGDFVVVDTRMTTSKHRKTTGDGDVEKFQGGTSPIEFLVSRQSGGWLIGSIQAIEK
jgi:Family of unknown function (DUF6318)